MTEPEIGAVLQYENLTMIIIGQRNGRLKVLYYNKTRTGNRIGFTGSWFRDDISSFKVLYK